MIHKKYKVAAFFSGVGGIELGFEQTGYFNTLYANEFDKYEDIIMSVCEFINFGQEEM